LFSKGWNISWISYFSVFNPLNEHNSFSAFCIFLKLAKIRIFILRVHCFLQKYQILAKRWILGITIKRQAVIASEAKPSKNRK